MDNQTKLFIALITGILLTSGCTTKEDSPKPEANTLTTFNVSKLNKYDDKIICRGYPYDLASAVPAESWDAILDNDLIDSGKRVNFDRLNAYCKEKSEQQYKDRTGRCHNYLTGRFERCRIE